MDCSSSILSPAPALFTESVANGTSVLQSLRFPFSCREQREKKRKGPVMLPAAVPGVFTGRRRLCSALLLSAHCCRAESHEENAQPALLAAWFRLSLFPWRGSGFSEESLSELLLIVARLPVASDRPASAATDAGACACRAVEECRARPECRGGGGDEEERVSSAEYHEYFHGSYIQFFMHGLALWQITRGRLKLLLDKLFSAPPIILISHTLYFSNPPELFLFPAVCFPQGKG